MIKESSLFYYLPIAWALVLCEIKAALLSISYKEFLYMNHLVTVQMT